MTPEYVEETVELGGHALTLVRPASADELIDEEAFDEEEFLPYWAELWPSGIALAEAVGALDLRGSRVLELGAGLGLPSLAAALGGADVLATDWAEDAVELLRLNAGAQPRGALRVRAACAGTSPSRFSTQRPGRSSSAPTCSTSGATPTSCSSCCRGSAPTSCSPIRAGPSRRVFSSARPRRGTIETTPDAELPHGGLHRLRLR